MPAQQPFKTCSNCGEQLALHVQQCGSCNALQPPLQSSFPPLKPTVSAHHPRYSRYRIPETRRTLYLYIACPYCNYQNPEGLEVGETYPAPSNSNCPQCKGAFATRMVTIRAKNARGERKTNTRTFNIRVTENGKEGLIQFDSNAWDDFELRSGDDAVFSYVDGKLARVQNFTVGRILDVTSGQQWELPYKRKATVEEMPQERSCGLHALLFLFCLGWLISTLVRHI
jgi:hypothetical protein